MESIEHTVRRFLLYKIIALINKEYLKGKYNIVSSGEKRSLRKVTEARALFVGLTNVLFTAEDGIDNMQKSIPTIELAHVMNLKGRYNIHHLNKKFDELFATEIFFRAFYKKLKDIILYNTNPLFTKEDENIKRLFTEKRNLLNKLRNINTKLKIIWLEGGMQVENLP